MHIICLTPVEDGVYNDHSAEHITAPPEGWAVIPDNMPLPSTFPRLGSITAEELTYTREVEVQIEDGTVKETQEYKMRTVTHMTEGTLPEVVPDPEPEPTADELINALLGVEA